MWIVKTTNKGNSIPVILDLDANRVSSTITTNNYELNETEGFHW